MRKLIAFLMLLLFTFGCAAPIINDVNKQPNEDTTEVTSSTYEIVKVEMSTLNGKPIQTVYLRDGTEMVFNDKFIGITDLDLRLNYMTYNHLKDYKEVKDSLKSQLPDIDNSMVDFYYFNHFLASQGMKIITYDDYKDNINKGNIAASTKQLSYILWISIGLSLVTISVILLFLKYFADSVRANSDNGNFLYLGRRNSS